MKKLPLLVYFALAFLGLLISTALIPSIRLWNFSPFLVISFYRCSKEKSAQLAFASGLLLDLFSSQFQFGMFALVYLLVSLVLYGQKNHFFEDRALPFFLYTALTSSFLSLFMIFFSLFGKIGVKVTLPLLFSDLLMLPFLDAIYALVWFFSPSYLYSLFTQKRGV